MRAADGRLNQEGVRLAGRPVNGSFVAHIKIYGNLRFFPVIKEKFCKSSISFGVINNHNDPPTDNKI